MTLIHSMRVALTVFSFAVLALSAGCSNTVKVKPPEPDKLRPLTEVEAEPSLLWTTDVGDGSDRSVVRYTPYVDRENVYAVNAKGQLSALNRETGTIVWQVSVGGNPTAGVGGDDLYLYVGTGDGKLVCIDQKDGSTVWTTNVSSEVIAVPVPGVDYVVVRSIDGRVYSLDKQNGTRRWIYTYTVPALSLHGNGRPVVLNDGVLVGLDNGRLAALRDADGRVFWEARLSEASGRSEIDRLNDLDGDVVVDRQGIYAVNYQGAVAQIAADTGQRRWSVDLSSSVGLDAKDGSVVVTDEFDTIWLLSASDGQVLWKNDSMSNRLLTAPTITENGSILLGDFEGFLHILSGDSGESVGRIKATSGQITNKLALRPQYG